MWKIDKDNLDEGIDEGISRVGKVGTTINLGLPTVPDIRVLPFDENEEVRFRLLDDDNEVYYEGLLDDDPDCLNQQAALMWGAHDAGCTTIEVRRDGEWVVEIG